MDLTNIFNPLMIWLLRSPLHKIASKNTLLITSLRGRSWWKNLRRDAKISVHLQGKDLETQGEDISDGAKVVYTPGHGGILRVYRNKEV